MSTHNPGTSPPRTGGYVMQYTFCNQVEVPAIRGRTGAAR
jgi:hypothetical protein